VNLNLKYKYIHIISRYVKLIFKLKIQHKKFNEGRFINIKYFLLYSLVYGRRISVTIFLNFRKMQSKIL